MARSCENAADGTVLAVDVSNSTTRFGVSRAGKLAATWGVTTPSSLTPDEALSALHVFFSLREVSFPFDDAIVSSVVPALSDSWMAAVREVSRRRPLLVGPGLKTGLRMRFNDPGVVGSDRIADMVAAKTLFEGPIVVIDLGTTTNFEVVDEEGSFAGGIIAPGLKLSLSALAATAAKLTMVEVKAPASVIGKSTEAAMQSGAVLGEVARIDGLIDSIWDELGYSTALVMSGDNAGTLSALCAHDIVVVDDLTLVGLFELSRLNRRK